MFLVLENGKRKVLKKLLKMGKDIWVERQPQVG